MEVDPELAFIDHRSIKVLLVPVAGISPERYDYYCSLFEHAANDLPVEVRS